MPKATNALFDSVESFLAPFGARKLSTLELNSYKVRKYIAGWEIDTQLEYYGQSVLIRFLFENLPNQSPPSVVLSEPKLKPLSFPHLESDGELCVLPSRYILDLNNFEYITWLLYTVVELLDNALKGKINKHFEDEFLSYWYYHSQLNSNDISLLSPNNVLSRLIYSYRFSNDEYVFGDTREQIVKWLDNQNKLPKSENNKDIKLRKRVISRIGNSAIIFCKNAIHPKDYPKTVKDLNDIMIKEFEDESNKVMALIAETLSNKSISSPEILLSFTTDEGQALVGLRFDKNLFSRNGRKSPIDGFRDRIPLKVILERTRNMTVRGRLIKRTDPSWVVGRDRNADRDSIASHTVAIIGCGSIGSSVARLLVKSGVCNLILIDGESLQSENFSRHELGFNYHNINKALALKDKLCKEFPYVNIKAINEKFSYCDKFRNHLDNADLIFSATGNWYSDQQLLKLQSEEFYPIVFSFVEAHAMAGHVIVNPPRSDAFNRLHHCCGHQVGIMKNTATCWPSGTIIKIPACAGEFQPYGAIEIGHVHSIAAKKIISILMSNDEDILNLKASHSIWFGDTDDLLKLGGKWNNCWEQYGFHIDLGSKILDLCYLGNSWQIRGKNV
ncbi:ThiF family adenylyltransferase [Celerinatantimonas diazotrophica]|uniref:E2/UBC family protein B n=1 Tax=Celerinatantimonas diazotrophica TaxID=412034 RepID=A0A4R1KJW5_9GAMM|nr:ThiF family adenylyltransferase [Celerinatantimonas diazotrophica]TCK63899.1 E2/UBC family protein B [Celerinatantimonas diazotrophica]CAG9296984.1 hypothetical protein CEDIAZO_02146 [Celerinatantimonas diazotrophica]